MIGGIPWPDLLFAAVMALAIFKGFARGFVKELGGLVAILAATIAPWYYNGSADWIIAKYTDLGPPLAHAAGMIGTSIAAYLIVMAVVMIIGTIVKLPILGLGNKIAGGLVGFVKGYALLWFVLFFFLFFPLTPAIRTALHESHLAPFFTAYDSTVDNGIISAAPEFARPFLQPYFANHRL
jgi:membrane protein required for colicin V production